MNSGILSLIGGSALLVYSIDELAKSVQYLAGSRLRTWVNLFAENRVSGVILGIVLSMLLSSSGAVTVILVGLASARLLTLEQVFSVTLGASIGTTFIVQLFAFGAAKFGLVFVAVGVAISALSRSDKLVHTAQSLIFLGMMFFSMGMVVEAGKALESNRLFLYAVNYFKDRPIVSLFISAAFTALVQSSAATIAFVMSLTVARGGTLMEAFPWMLGANLGTTATAYFASLQGGILGKQAALGHLLCKVVGIVLCYPFMEYAVNFIMTLAPGDVSRQIAHSHTLFNIAVAILFFPFVSLGVKTVKRLVYEDEEQSEFQFRYLDSRSMEAPELAIAQAHREILRLSDLVEQMVERSVLLFNEPSETEVNAIKEMDQVVDFLNKGIKLYLTKLSRNLMTPEQVHREFEFLLRTNDLENIGDIVDKNILALLRKNMKKGAVFSKEGWKEIGEFHRKVLECLRLSTAYFSSRDRALYTKILLLHESINQMGIELSEKHVQRLHRGVKETLDTTSVHLDLLGYLERIADLAVNFRRIPPMKSDVEEASR